MSGQTNVLLSAVLTLLLIAQGCAAALTQSVAAASPVNRNIQEIRWGPCDPQRTDLDPAVRCGTMTLPVDWSDPMGLSYTARVYRQPTQGVPRGTAIYFPSGPGETADIGFSTLSALAPGYDLIGIDPRGVSSTSPVTCDASAVLAMPLATPIDPVAFFTGQAKRARISQSCRTTPGALRRHLDAYSDARDAEALSTALGSPPLLVTGSSFGTLLAARYLELFGNHARGAVLDGVLDPGADRLSFQRTAAAASQQLFDEFSAWCARASGCAVHGVGASRAFASAKQRADNGAIPGRTQMGRRWTAAGVVQAFELEASHGDFRATATAIAALARGVNPYGSSGDTMSAPPGTYIPYPDEIICSNYDLGIRDLPTAIQVAAASWHHDIPYNTNSAAYTVGCAGAAPPATTPQNPFRAGGEFPILLVSNRLDIATPRQWAATVARRLGARARQVVTRDIGHGALANPQARRAVTRYIDSLSTP